MTSVQLLYRKLVLRAVFFHHGEQYVISANELFKDPCSPSTVREWIRRWHRSKQPQLQLHDSDHE